MSASQVILTTVCSVCVCVQSGSVGGVLSVAGVGVPVEEVNSGWRSCRPRNSCLSHIAAADSRLPPRRVKRTQCSSGLNPRHPCWTAHPPKSTWRARTSHWTDPRQNTYATRSWTSKEGRKINLIFQTAIFSIFFYTDILIRLRVTSPVKTCQSHVPFFCT
jgi:hypothetical protein